MYVGPWALLMSNLHVQDWSIISMVIEIAYCIYFLNKTHANQVIEWAQIKIDPPINSQN